MSRGGRGCWRDLKGLCCLDWAHRPFLPLWSRYRGGRGEDKERRSRQIKTDGAGQCSESMATIQVCQVSDRVVGESNEDKGGAWG